MLYVPSAAGNEDVFSSRFTRCHPAESKQRFLYNECENSRARGEGGGQGVRGTRNSFLKGEVEMNRYLRRAHVKDRSHTQCVKRAKKRLLQQQGKKKSLLG